MYIKNIIISGFRSYREQSFPDGLSTGTNVIVGKNGSGKSNFFAAIQFVLSERFSNLRAVERKELFHVGSGRPALSIFVEIVFDNSDGRLVIPGRAEEAEVRIRRTVGLKQDEFRVNERKFSAIEVRQLLESAGFSSSNPYYVVEQGKIISLVNISEEERYHIIKDVAGTQVYENRRKESEKILADTEVKQKQIDKSIAELETKLGELEQELQELKEYREVDEEKQCIEYCIFKTELENTRESLDKLEKERVVFLSSLNKDQDSTLVSENQVNALSEKLNYLKSELSVLEEERRGVEKEITELNNKQAVMEINAGDASSRRIREEKERTQLLNENDQLKITLKKAKENLSNKKKAYEECEKEATDIFSEVDKSQKRLQKLQERRNRSKLFKNKQERDKWLQEEIHKNETLIKKSKKQIAETQKEITECENKIKKEMEEVPTSQKSEEHSPTSTDNQENKIKNAFEKRDKLNQQRRDMWQSVREQEAVVKRLEEALSSARRRLDHVCRHDLRQGLQSLQEILLELNDNKISSSVFGSLIDLISVDEGYEAAVEVTAGNTLFNVVVDSFDTSAFLLEQMNKRRKPGRISFLPLDTCKGVKREFPTTSEGCSLLSKVHCEKKFEGVAAEILGRTYVVSTLDLGAKLSKDLSCDVVTVDGDQVGRKGAITGGYLDKRNMKINVHRAEKKLREELEKEEKVLAAMCQKVAAVEHSITEVLNYIEELRNKGVSEESRADNALREKRLREERISHLKTSTDNLREVKRNQEKIVQDGEVAIATLKEEMAEEFRVNWSPENEAELEKLLRGFSSLKTKSAAAQSKALQLGTEKQLLEDTVAHLERRIKIVEDRIKEINLTKFSGNINHEVNAVLSELKQLNSRLGSISTAIETKTKEISAVEAELESVETRRISAAVHLQDRRDVIDKSEIQRKLLTQRRDEALLKIRQLRVLPKGAERYSKYSIGKLMNLLKQQNEKLNKFSHVNRKATDQYASLTETRNDLVSQKESLEKERQSISELIAHLDQQKDEAIGRTYKQIQFHFEEVFKELVGQDDCVAELQLVKPDNNLKRDDPYVGARIRVSFGLGVAVSDLEQLSGGQKSLVALALIFSIQRCDPAPFYLFDEIDAALDSEYRTSVAKMIEKQSATCQFLIASFKTEVLSVAQKVLGIFFHNKVSRIQTISKEEGVQLLKQAAEEDRKRQRSLEE